jgi:hypothetical protein
MAAHGSDVCECGDYRSEHNENGRCRVCCSSSAPYDGCVKFRFSRSARPNEIEHWNLYHAHHKTEK